ncbi:FG-GAP-like repeat-containing protein [Streptomyces albiaxialis]|uniref:FG-GAP-like repeat-containing protein n=1 Tax=Streptomyces albiaxialis TaxID=329523 RepID=A0ABP5I1L7_9ACTN
MRKRSLTAGIAVASAMAAGLSLVAVQTAGAATGDTDAKAGKKAAKAAKAAAYKADFNGDGYADTVSAGSNGTVAGVKGAGYVTVVYGSAKGADPKHRQIITQKTSWVPGDPEQGGGWGGVLAARDFDGNGVTDLAVSAPGNDTGVTILWGSKGKGLDGANAVEKEVDGSKLAAGDFNGDGKDDLAVGKKGSWSDLQVLHGPFKGGQAADSEDVTADVGDSELGEITAGDVTGDGIDDLFGTYGFEEMSRKSQFWKGSKSGMAKAVATQDAATATVGDVDKDGYGDLVVRTVPGGVLENLPYDHGTVKVLYGTADGPSKTRSTTLTQNSAGVPGKNEEGDEFGASLTAGDVNGDGYADIAAGVPGEDIGTGASGKDTGAIVQLLGGKGGLSGTGAKNWDQGTEGVPGAVEAGDRFGQAVSLRDTDGDGKDDLAIGAPEEDGTSAEKDAGAVWSLRGAKGGLTATGVTSWGPTALGAPASDARLGVNFAR